MRTLTYNGSITSDFGDKHKTFNGMGTANNNSGTSVVFGSNVTYIPKFMFGAWEAGWGSSGTSYVGNIISLTIPSSVNSVGLGAFRYLYNLKNIYYNGSIPLGYLTSNPSKYYHIFEHLGKDSGGAALTIGSNVTCIPDYFFTTDSSYTPNITSVTFDDQSQCTAIGKWAFDRNSNLTSISIPASVTYIGSTAFGSTGLSTVIFAVTTGWWYADSEGGSYVGDVDLTSNPANTLKNNNKYWYRTVS